MIGCAVVESVWKCLEAVGLVVVVMDGWLPCRCSEEVTYGAMNITRYKQFSGEIAMPVALI